MNEERDKVFNFLKEINIQYQIIEHPAIFTVLEAKQINLKGTGCKNLFLRNQKKTNYYLAILEENTNLDIKVLSKKLNESRLSFASEADLERILKTTKGSVSLFNILNSNEIIVVLDEKLKDKNDLLFHPNDNTASIVISYNNILRILENKMISHVTIKI